MMAQTKTRMAKRPSWGDLDGSNPNLDVSGLTDCSPRRASMDNSSTLDRSDTSRQSYSESPMVRRSSWGDLDAMLGQFQGLTTGGPIKKPRRKKRPGTNSLRSSTSSRSSATSVSTTGRKRDNLKRKGSKNRTIIKDT